MAAGFYFTKEVSLDKLIKVSDGVDKVVTVMMFVAIMGFLIVMLMQVFLRNVAPQHALTWADGVCRYFFIWASFMAAARAIKHRRHIAITIVTDVLKGFAKQINLIFIAIVFMILLIVTFKVGLDGIKITSVQKSDSLPISVAWIYAAIPIGAAFSIFQLLATSLETFVKPPTKTLREMEVTDQL